MSTIALIGPTASGKTELAIELARRLDAEIIGADSRQVYRRLDIGSAKPTAEQRAAVPHHLLDVVEPDESFDCARFRELALAAIADIERRGKRALVVGGTGLYVKVLRHGLFAGPRRDEELRARLREEEANAPGALYRRLQQVDAAAAGRIAARDHVRLIRALEVFELTGTPISLWQQQHRFSGATLEMRVVGLDVPREELHRRIEVRCHAMVEAGLIDEVRALYAAGFAPALPSLQSPGYVEIGEHVRGLCSLEDALARMARATRRLAKRQSTWFRGHPPDAWVVPEISALLSAAES